MRSANLALSFLLELVGLGALVYWGLQTTNDPIPKVAFTVGAPLVMAVLWGLFVAPRSALRVRGVLKALSSLVILEITAVALILAGRLVLGLVFAALIVANAALAAYWRRQHSSSPEV